MARNIIPLLPAHTVYVEPFCGGAAVFFAKGRPGVTSGHYYMEVLNDRNENLVSFYRTLQDPELGDRLRHRLEHTPYSRAELKLAHKILDDQGASQGDRAWAWFVGVSMAFAKQEGCGWGFAVSGLSSAYTWALRRSRIAQTIERIGSVHIECDDALAVIDRWDSPQTLFYCDPPYPGTELGHYRGYTSDDFAALVAKLDSCQGSFLLSNYEQPGIPGDWERFAFAATMSAANLRSEKRGEKRTEIVWRVDRSHTMRADLRKVASFGSQVQQNLF